MPPPERERQGEPVQRRAEIYTVRYPETQALPLVHINKGVGASNLRRDISRNRRDDSRDTPYRAPQLEINPWRAAVSKRIDWDYYDELPGGHSNLAIRSKSDPREVRIVWRETDRWPLIMESVLLEDAVTRLFPNDTDGETVQGRQLLDPNKPLEVTSKGLLVSKVNFLEGDPHRYTWNTAEIASVAKAMATIDRYLRHISFDPHHEFPAQPDSQLVQADVTPGNVLFKYRSPDVAAVIDYERARRGSIEECVARTAGYVLSNSRLPIPGRDPKKDIFAQTGDVPTQQTYPDIIPVFQRRFETLISTFNDQVHEFGGTEANMDDVITLTTINLALGRFGSLDHVADMALRWLDEDYSPPTARSNTTTTG